MKHAPETGFHHRDTESEVQKFRRPVNGERIEGRGRARLRSEDKAELPDLGQVFTLWGRAPRPFAVVGLNFLEVCDGAQPKTTGGMPVFHLIVGATVSR